MNLNILTYGIYSAITALIVVKVGWMFYKNGAHYLHDLFENDLETADTINRLLLVGYYLINLGYVAVSLNYWPAIQNLVQMIELISQRSGFIILGLGAMHYVNMLWVKILKSYLKTT